MVRLAFVRRCLKELDEVPAEVEGRRVIPEPSTPEWSEKHLRLAIRAAGVALWSWNVDNDNLTMDEQAYELWGLPPSAHVSFEDLSAHIHPADRDRVRAAFAATRGIVGPYEIDFRIMVADQVRWVSARGQGDDADIVGRVMFGVFLDVTGRKQAEEGHELLAGEMSHRVKNLLAIATSLTTITSRSAKTTVDMARELTERMAALGRAHDLVRPLPGKEGKAALLGDLLAILLAPYDDLGAFSGRVRVAVPRMGVGVTAATTLALVIHELATNSLKYGALSSATGTLDVACDTPEKEITVVWTERGGPPVVAPGGQGGFGSRLVKRGMEQLGGSIEIEWSAEGAIARLRMNEQCLAR
jgi:two-component sensor histidine kinase